jgi:hypothetical protein
VTAAARGKKVLTRLIAAEKGRGLPLVTQVKPDNKSDMVARLKPERISMMLVEGSVGVTADKHSSPAFCVSYFILRREFQMS